ncbi:hypothetical protein ILUMI_17065 [Ignelater luminosus]|uniref:Major facilitator superfamily (MFS) profile domain-containing protein n=1 Tax=Ignelater luminosus TaxID=2038154 RepID=A0A8K0G5D8_IGNLU|nr:hypothetical protein ILUMI_17065 [Ignelater luminosus]
MMTFETFGELLVYCIGPYVTLFFFSILTVIITLLTGIFIFQFLPESPFYLLSKQRRSLAENALILLRNDTRDGVKLELEYIQAIIQESEHTQGRIVDLCESKASRRAEITTIGLTIFQHFSGILPIVLYSQDIFNVTGSKIPAEYCTMSFGAIQFLSSFIAPNLVDRLGRRWMLFLSGMGMAVSEFALGLYFYRKDNGMTIDKMFWLPVASLLIFIVSYISGFGPLIWTIMSEMFPIHLKAAAFSVGFCIWWMLAFIVGAIFYPVSNAIGMSGCFWMFASCGFAGTIFIWAYVIETKGKSLQEIQQLLSK